MSDGKSFSAGLHQATSFVSGVSDAMIILASAVVEWRISILVVQNAGFALGRGFITVGPSVIH